jgi:hypothetical protein
MTKEVLKLALEALEMFCEHGAILRPIETKDAIKAALEAKDEPVAWAEEIIDDLDALYNSEMIKENDSGDALIRLDAAVCVVEEVAQKHTTPPQRKPLTDEEIFKALGGIDCTRPTLIARAIEAAHGIKGEA